MNRPEFVALDRRTRLAMMAAQIAGGGIPAAMSAAASERNGGGNGGLPALREPLNHRGMVCKNLASWAMEIALEIDSNAEAEASEEIVGMLVEATSSHEMAMKAGQAAYNEYCARAPDGYRRNLLPWSDIDPEEQGDWAWIANKAIAAIEGERAVDRATEAEGLAAALADILAFLERDLPPGVGATEARLARTALAGFRGELPEAT